jgi:hypothetical protein
MVVAVIGSTLATPVSAQEDADAELAKKLANPIASLVSAPESTYYWENEAWSVPVIGHVSQLFKIGPQILQFTVGAKYWAESPDNGPQYWGFQAQLTFLFPK